MASYSSQESDASLDSYLEEYEDTHVSHTRVLLSRAPKAPSKYALYQHEGEAHCGHYDHGAPMPLRTRAHLFLDSLGYPTKHLDTIVKLVRSNVRKDERYLKSIRLDEETSAVMDDFYRHADFFGINRVHPSQIRRVVVADCSLDDLLKPKHLGGTPSKPKDHDVTLSQCLETWRNAKGEYVQDGPLPVPLHYGPTSYSLTTDIQKPDPLPSSSSSTSGKKSTLQFDTQLDPLTKDREVDHYKETFDQRFSPDEDTNILPLISRLISNPPVSFRFKIRDKQLVLTSNPRALLDFLDGATPSDYTIKGRYILVPPGSGKTKWLETTGLTDIVIDLDAFAEVDFTELRLILDLGITVVSCDPNFVKFLSTDEVLIIHYRDDEAAFSAYRVDFHTGRTNALRDAVHKFQKFCRSFHGKVITLEDHQNVSDKTTDIHRWMMTRFSIRLKNLLKTYKDSQSDFKTPDDVASVDPSTSHT